MPPKPACTSPYDGIKQQLTVDACSSSTIKLLTESFTTTEPNVTSATVKISSRSKNAKLTSQKVATETVTVAVSPASRIVEKQKLAIEVINICLKALTDAAKKDAPPPSAPEISAPARKTGKLVSTNSKPLQSRSANRNDTKSDPIANLASCCALSISYLNSIQHTSSLPEMPPLQVETAQNSLLLKLIQLGMFEMALKEARSLKRKLTEHMQNGSAEEKQTNGVQIVSAKSKHSGKEGGATKPEKESFSKMLEFKDVTASVPAFPLVISCQLGMLRCLAGLKRPELIEAIIPSLSAQYNPLSLIKVYSKSSPSKALTHLNVLIHTLLSITPSTAVSSDSDATNIKLFCSPKTALELQTLATQCGVLRKRLQSNNTGIIEKDTAEQWESWRKYLTAFVRRSQEQRTKPDRYKFIQQTSNTVRQILHGSNSSKSLPLEVIKTLATVSFDAGLLKESMNCTEELLMELEAMNNESDSALKVISNVRLATIELKLSTIGKDGELILDNEIVEGLKERVEIAVEGLASIRNGRKADLELLLNEVALLRRGGVSLLASLLKDETDSEERVEETVDDKEARWTLRILCDSIARGVIRFCGKYLTMVISDEERAKATKIVTSTIDTAISTSWRGFIISSPDAWEAVEDLVKESLTIIRSLPENDIDHATFYEKFSTTYWQIHLLYRKAGMDKPSILALRRSLMILERRPSGELVQTNAALKWERLGSLFLLAGDYRRAEDALLSAVNVFFETGTLEEIGQSAMKGELPGNAFDLPTKEATVDRVLAGLVKCANKKKDGVASSLRFDYAGISKTARGAMLEWSMRLAIGTTGSDGTVAQILAERLLDLYSFEEMPLRRARVISKLLELAVDHADLINKEEAKSLGEETFEWAEGPAAVASTEDKHLLRYKDDIIAGCLVSLSFLRWQDGEVEPELVKNALELWNRLVNECITWDAVVEKMEDINQVMKKLEMVAEFFEMKGEVELKICALKVLVSFRGIEDKANYDSLVQLQSLLGIQYLRLGYSGRAGMALVKAQALISKALSGLSSTTVLQFHLAYTEYLVNIGNLEKAEEYFLSASALVDEDEELISAKISGAKIAKRVKINRIIADAAYAMSLLTFEKGNPNDALTHARRCVRLNQRAWAGLEALSKPTTPKSDSLIQGMAALTTSSSAPKVHSTTLAAFNTPLLWPLVSALHSSLLQASNIYRHQGMVREAEFYLQQALKTVEAVNATSRMAKTMTLYGDLKVRAGLTEEGTEMLEQARELITNGHDFVEIEVAAGNLERIRGDWQEESEAYERAEKHLEELMAVDRIENLGSHRPDSQIVVEKMSKMVLDGENKQNSRAKAPAKRRGRVPTTKSKAAKDEIEKASSSVSLTSTVVGECSTLLKQKGNVLRLKAHNFSMQQKCEKAEALLKEAAKLPIGHQEAVVHGLTEARHLFQEALILMSSDPIFGVLQDSTISLPNIALHKSENLDPTTKSTRKPAKERKAVTEFMELLEKARDAVYNVHTRAIKCGSSTMTHSVASLLSEIIVLIHAVSSVKGKGPEHPFFASYSLELHKGLSIQREKAAIEAERISNSIPEDLSWPINGPHGGTVATELNSFEFSSFQQDYVDIIPNRWAAVSISLNERRDELYVSRFQAGESQFMIRLPLTRGNSRDDSEAVFEYGECRQELDEIIEGANTSAHNAKEMTSKGARKEWWEEREALDSRLGDLLENIEHVWFCGFKGIFCQYARYSGLLARFKATFEKVLAKYLPSRKRKKAGKVNIDHRVLELFIGLGPSEGQETFNEMLVDLIFYVVDILQFHGEGNAYDELDTDEMVVELTDALDSYHQEVSFHVNDAERGIDHTILILDKSVHMFPWESIPCLRGHSVSRLPSLAALRERILKMQEKSPSQTVPGFYVDRDKGSYILNPSSDLVSTQNMFEDGFKNLDGWEGIINKEPSEEQFRNYLKTRDLLIYSGHGSGAHYIRGKTVKKLEQCAVSMLLGCSSGAMKDSGEFEPYGMSLNYLLGGCPTLLATLWDVTDKDIDRFSKDVFDRWGLFNKTDKSSRKVKGRATSPSAGVSLVEAVAKGRDCCSLKYLNGAAPVVYGIPAYLSI
ncbi:uncharacterized protein H6S33_009361 [Morchella sextelata]|uniref:uncharacterized protein n=1 Tax=Morchella sextelata TaxID=1174677 RepID=UPI001D050D74|nr:uncharacterized protein H6S33_009361 [Morchella sextelata]KAH0612981.1 hypothetical protein H6S33_009361 [Morchella sextelata]